MPVQIVLARHTLRAPFNGTHKLRRTKRYTKLPSMGLGLFVALQILLGILAISKVCVTRLAFVRFVCTQVQSITTQRSYLKEVLNST